MMNRQEDIKGHKSTSAQVHKCMILIALMLLCFCALLLFGCARTVTDKVTFGTSLVVEVNFRGNLDMTNNRYYMIIASTDAYQLPYASDGHQFVEPGVPAFDSTYFDYWQYYRTWHSYVVLDNSATYFLVNGPFNSSGETYVRQSTGNSVSGTTSKMTFNIALSQIFGTTVPPTIYFDFVAVDGPSGYLRDHIQPPSKYISSYSGSDISGTNYTEYGTPSLDITTWRVYIQ